MIISVWQGLVGRYLRGVRGKETRGDDMIL